MQYTAVMVDVCANETLDALAHTCNPQVVTFRFESGRYQLDAIDLDTFEQYTIHADNLMDAVVALGEQIGIDWEDI
ncbi:MAG: hypothetical protein IH984_11530 [Planctomycetes bacterium]|nr:hypothetical protein [Planctomycetota bacterium]